MKFTPPVTLVSDLIIRNLKKSSRLELFIALLNNLWTIAMHWSVTDGPSDILTWRYLFFWFRNCSSWQGLNPKIKQKKYMSIKVEKCLALLPSQNLQHLSWVVKEIWLYMWLLSTVWKGWGECSFKSSVSNEVVVQLYIKIYTVFPRDLLIFQGLKKKKKSALFQDYTHRYSYCLYALDSFDMAVPPANIKSMCWHPSLSLKHKPRIIAT